MPPQRTRLSLRWAERIAPSVVPGLGGLIPIWLTFAGGRCTVVCRGSVLSTTKANNIESTSGQRYADTRKLTQICGVSIFLHSTHTKIADQLSWSGARKIKPNSPDIFDHDLNCWSLATDFWPFLLEFDNRRSADTSNSKPSPYSLVLAIASWMITCAYVYGIWDLYYVDEVVIVMSSGSFAYARHQLGSICTYIP